MKKFLSLFLAIVMVLAVAISVVPTALAAETTEGADDAYWEVNGKYFPTLSEAVAVANNGDTINLLKDYTQTNVNQTGISKSVKINGNNHTYYAPTNTNKFAIGVSGGAELSVYDLTMDVQSGFNVTEGVLRLDNVDISADYRVCIKSDGATLAEIYLNDCNLETVTDGGQKEPVILLNATLTNVFKVTGNSTLNRKSAANSGGNASVINIGGSAKEVDISLGSNVEMIMNQATGGQAYAYGICDGTAGNVYVTLEDGFTVVSNTTLATVDFLKSVTTSGAFIVEDKGADFLVKDDTTPTIPTPVISNRLDADNKYVAAATVRTGYTTYNLAADTLSYGTANSFLYVQSGAKTVGSALTLDTVISAADENTAIVFLGDYSATVSAQNQYKSSKNLCFYGNGYNVTWTCSAESTFPAAVSSSKWMAYNNFGTIYTSGGGFDAQAGTISLSNITSVQSKGRVAVKTSSGGTADVVVREAALSVASDGGTNETAAILGGSGTNRMFFLTGSSLTKNNKSNNQELAAAAAIYLNNGGTHTLTVGSGAKIVNNQAANGTNKDGSVIGVNGTKKATINIRYGGYLVNDSANATNFWFICNTGNAAVKLNAHTGAYLVKTGLTPTVNTYNDGVEYGSHAIAYTKNETSAVSGYDQYSLTLTKDAETFVYTNTFGEAIPVSFKTALTGLPTTATVKLNADKTTTESGLTFASGRTLTIDLNGNKLDATAAAYLMGSVKGTLTVKNGTLNVKRGIVLQSGANVTFDGVTGNVTERPYFKQSGAGTSTLNINNSTITNSANGETLILIEQTHDGILNVTGTSTIAHIGGASGAPNCAVIAVQQAWGTGVDGNAASSNTDAVITIGAGAKVLSGYKNDNTKPGACIIDQTYGNVTVNLEAGSILAIERTYAAPGYFFWENQTTVEGNTDGVSVVNDNGAIYSANAAAMAAGVYLPATVTNGTDTLIGFTGSDGKLYGTGAVVKGDADTTFAPTYMGANDYDMIDGASLRTVYQENGLRFTTYATDALMAKLANANAYEFHTLIASTELLGTSDFTAALATGADDAVAVDVTSTKVHEDFENADITYDNAFHAAILLNDENVDAVTRYQLQVSARGYLKITYANGCSATFYTDYDTNNVRSMLQVAENLAAADDYVPNRVVDGVIEACATNA